MKTRLLIIIGLVVFLVFSIIIHQNFDFSKMGKTDSFSSLTCQNAISDLVNAAHRIPSVPQENLKSGKILHEKNDATLAALNHCDLESMTMNDIGILFWEIENEN